MSKGAWGLEPADLPVARRTFLGSLMAVTATLAGGVTMPASRQARGASAVALQTQSKVYSLTSLSSTLVGDGLLGYRAEYIHLPNRSGPSDEEKMIASHLKGMRPVSVRFHASAGQLTTLTVEWA